MDGSCSWGRIYIMLNDSSPKNGLGCVYYIVFPHDREGVSQFIIIWGVG